mgnify:FL=1
MKKVIAVCMLGLLLLTGCSPAPLPEGMEEDAVEEAGWAVAKLLIDGDYAAVLEEFRPDVGENITEENISLMMETATEDAGEFVSRSDMMVTGQSSDGEDYGVAVILCEYREEKVLFRIAFDPDMALIGIEATQQ